MNLKQAKNRRNPSQTRSKERVAVILEAVKELIEEKNISNLKITDIAKRANTSPASIYRYFSDKEEIILSLAGHFNEEIQKIVNKHGQALLTLEDLEVVLNNNFDDIYLLHKNESALRQIWFESIDTELVNLATVASSIKADIVFQSVLRIAQPKDEAQLKQFIMLMSLLFSSVMRLCFSSEQSSPEQLKKIYVDTVMSGMANYM